MKLFKLLTVALFASILFPSCTSLEGRYDDVKMPVYALMDPSNGELKLTFEEGSSAALTISVNADYSTIAVELEDSSWLSYAIEENVITFTSLSDNGPEAVRETTATITAGPEGEVQTLTATITQAKEGVVLPAGSFEMFEATQGGVVYWISDDGMTAKIMANDYINGAAWALKDVADGTVIGNNLMEDGAEASAAVLAAADYSAENYPAFAYCAGYGSGWYVPSITELSTFISLYITDATAINAAFIANGGMEFQEDMYHLSSNEADDAAESKKSKKGKYKSDAETEEEKLNTTTLSKNGAKHNTRCTKVINKTPYELYQFTDGGIVVWASEDGQSAKIMSADYMDNLAWAIDGIDETVIGNSEVEEGSEAFAAVLAAADYSAENYPAFAYCQSKGEGWYIPSQVEMESFVTLYVTDASVINEAFTSNGGMAFVEDEYHQTSNEKAEDATAAHKVKYKPSGETDEDKVNSTTLSKNGAKHTTRCFRNVSKN